MQEVQEPQQPEKEASQDDRSRVREQIEDKRTAVLVTMSPSLAMDYSLQRSGQHAFPQLTPMSTGQFRASQLSSPGMSPYSGLSPIQTSPLPASQSTYEELVGGTGESPEVDYHGHSPRQQQQQQHGQPSLADRLRTSLTGGSALSSRMAESPQQSRPPPHNSSMQQQEEGRAVGSPAFHRDSAASSRAAPSTRGRDIPVTKQGTPVAMEAQLQSALRVCSDAGALGAVLHSPEPLHPSPAAASHGNQGQSTPFRVVEVARAHTPQQQVQLHSPGRGYPWDSSQQQQPPMPPREKPPRPAAGDGYGSPEGWISIASPASIGTIEEPLRGQPIGYLSDLVSAAEASSVGGRGHVIKPTWERPAQPSQLQQQPQPQQQQMPSVATQRTMANLMRGDDDLPESHPGVDVPVVTFRQEAGFPTLNEPNLQLGPYSGGPVQPQLAPVQPQLSTAPLQAHPPAVPHLKRRRTVGPCAEVTESDDDVYVLFNLPPAHTQQTLQPPAPWDSPAAALLSLASSPSLGPVRCQWLFSKQLTASDTNKLGRIILPRQAVEHFLPWVEDRAGLNLNAWDTSTTHWSFKLKFWMNGSNPKRMYVVENTRDFVRCHNLKPGSILSFYYAPDGRLVVDPHPVDDYFDMAG